MKFKVWMIGVETAEATQPYEIWECEHTLLSCNRDNRPATFLTKRSARALMKKAAHNYDKNLENDASVTDLRGGYGMGFSDPYYHWHYTERGTNIPKTLRLYLVRHYVTI